MKIQPGPRKRWDDHGRPGPHSSEGLLDLWRTAAHLNEARWTDRGEYVPWRAIEVWGAILPREQLDNDAVEQYRENFDNLPPIQVQRGTLTLINGHHRLVAAPGAIRDHIRIIEVDVSDEDLREAAFLANMTNGVRMTPAERIAGARWLFERHHPDTGGTSGTPWQVVEIARCCGVARNTIDGWLSKDRTRATAAAAREVPKMGTSPDQRDGQAHDGDRDCVQVDPSPTRNAAAQARVGANGRPNRQGQGGGGWHPKGGAGQTLPAHTPSTMTRPSSSSGINTLGLDAVRAFVAEIIRVRPGELADQLPDDIETLEQQKSEFDRAIQLFVVHANSITEKLARLRGER